MVWLVNTSGREVILDKRSERRWSTCRICYMLAGLLLEFQDVFARSEFNFGNFNALEHEIDTGDAPSVKEHMRRTPKFFAAEEESHLKKMLNAALFSPLCKSGLQFLSI